MTQAPQKPSSNGTVPKLDPLPETLSKTGSPDDQRPQVSSMSPKSPALMEMAISEPKVGGRVKAPGRTLQSRLLLTLLPIVLVPLAVLGGINIWTTQKETTEELEEKLEGQVELSMEIATDLVESAFITPESIAENPLVIDSLRVAAQQAEADGLPQRSIEDLEAQFSDTKLLSPNSQLNNYLESVAATSGLAEIFYTERNGYNVAFSNETSDFVQSDEGWWERGAAETQFLDTPDFDASANTFSIDMIQAISDPDSGGLLGVMKAVLPADSFGIIGDYLDESGIEGSTEISVVDLRSGNALEVINAEGARTGADVVIDPTLIEIASAIRDSYTTAEAAGDAIELTELSESLTNQFPVRDINVEFGEENESEGDLEFREGSIPTVSFHYGEKHYSLSVDRELPWAAIASINQSDFTAASTAQTRTLLIELVILSALSIAAISWLAKQISKPLTALSGVAGQVAEGNLDVRAESAGTIETQTLAGSFNNLVQRVREQIFQQEQEVNKTQLLATIGSQKVADDDQMKDFVDNALEQARQNMKVDRMVIYRFNSDWSGYISNESVGQGWPVALNDSIEDACIPQKLIDAYMEDRVVPTTDVYNAGFHPDHLRLMTRLKIKANLVVPVLNEGTLYGILVAHHCAKTHEWTPTEINFMRQLALLFGTNLDRISSFRAQKAATEEQQSAKEKLQERALELLIEVDPISRGDLTVRAKVTEDEIGTIADSYNSTVKSLRQLVESVQEVSSEVANTTSQNEKSVRLLSEESQQQSQNISSALERIQVMSESIRMVSNNAGKAETAVKQASMTVAKGDEAMNQTVKGFQSIRETVAETSKKVKRLGESSQAITKVVNLIESFAAQTNQLVNFSASFCNIGQALAGTVYQFGTFNHLFGSSFHCSHHLLSSRLDFCDQGLNFRCCVRRLLR